jgi:hypothetical protein
MGQAMTAKTPVRTREQIEADKTDRNIFNAMRACEERRWEAAARHLRAARSIVREFMHPDDIEATR